MSERPNYYADQLVDTLRRTLEDGEHGLALVPKLVIRVVDEELWPERVVAVSRQTARFERFEGFVSRTPPEGLGSSVKQLKWLCRDSPEALDAIDRATQREAHRPISVDNINASSDPRPAGTSNAHALRKLRKDRPDLHERVLAGEISPHAAMVEAGFRRRTATFYPDDLERTVSVLLRRGIDRDELYEAMGEAMGEALAEPSTRAQGEAKPGQQPPQQQTRGSQMSSSQRRRRGRGVSVEIPETTLSYEELWEQHLALIDQVEKLFHKVFRWCRAREAEVLAEHGPGAEKVREAMARHVELAEMVKKARTVEVAKLGIVGELDTGREVRMVHDGKTLRTELGERRLELRAPNNSVLAKVVRRMEEEG